MKANQQNSKIVIVINSSDDEDEIVEEIFKPVIEIDSSDDEFETRRKHIDGGIKNNSNSDNSTRGTKAEEYKMLADQSESDQLAAMYAAIDARIKTRNRKRYEIKKSKKKTRDSKPDAKNLTKADNIPDSKNPTHVKIVVLPNATEVNPKKNDGNNNINSTQLSEAQSGDCSEVVEEDKHAERNNKRVRSDGGINRDNYVYRTKAEEYKMIAELGKCQLSGFFALESKVKNKSTEKIAKKRLKKRQKSTNAPTDGIQSSEVQKKTCIEGVVEVVTGDGVIPDIGVYKYRTKAEEYRLLANLRNCPQAAAVFPLKVTMKNAERTENQNAAAACMAEQQGENKLIAVETTEEVNTDDGLRSAIVTDPGLSFSEGLKGHEETACLGHYRKIPEFEQAETPVREEQKLFDGRDGKDIVMEIVKHGRGDSTKDPETTASLKLGSLRRGNNIVLQKLLRSPRYFDSPISSLQMCYICGKDNHRAAECTMERRKKPCYICGGFWHTGKNCKRGRLCFKCKGRGHLARNCLEESSSNDVSDICLRCGDSGHQMFLCQSDYPSEDLKEIRCYVCKEFGHLCCADFKSEGQTVVSCYKCGQNGHPGSLCVKQERHTGYAGAKNFYNHEVKDHSARKNGEDNEAAQCTHESTTVDKSFPENDIIPNFVHEPLKYCRGVPTNQIQRCDGSTV